MPKSNQAASLELVQEYKLHQLLNGGIDERFEASGICARGDFFYVTFDNAPHVARLGKELTSEDSDNHLFRQRGEGSGFEDITYDERQRRFYVLVRATPHSRGGDRARIEEYDEDFKYLESRRTDFSFKPGTRELKGLASVSRDGQDYLLGLCERNRGKGSAASRKPRVGRIKVFQKSDEGWKCVKRIKLPKTALFEDYTSLDVAGDRVAIASQTSSQLWVGTLQETGLEFVDEGRIYQFPKNEKGKIVYGNIEGVCWISPNQIGAVSDKVKAGGQKKRFREKDQSIHVFNMPDILD